MRLPITPQISTKDGVSAKNARLTNCLKESKKSGDMAVVRPGLVLDAQASGVGNGLVVFNDELVSVYGATLGLSTEPSSGGSLSVITDTIDGFCLTSCTRNIGGTEWLVGGLNTDTEVGELYLYDSSDDSTTAISTGSSVGDVKRIAYSGTTVVVATRIETFGGGSPKLIKADASTLTFSTVSGLTGIDPFSVKYGGGKFVSISTGASSYVHWSDDDGTTWDEYAIPTGNGRELLFDGTSWWFYCGNGTADMVVYKTTDFVTFSLQSITGLPANTGPSYCAYANGTYYCVGDYLYTSIDGLAWTATATVMNVVVDGSDGEIYGARYTTDALYSVSGVTVTEVTSTAFSGSYRVMDSNDDGSIIIGPTYAASVVRVDVSSGVDTIPTLATITNGKFDFVQSVI